MERIDLSMPVKEWIESCILNGTIASEAFPVAVTGGFWLLSVGQFCKTTEDEMLGIDGIGKKMLTTYCDALKEAGLHFGMADRELEAYQCAYESNKGNGPANKPNTIDWEQRRWELAVRIFMEAPYTPIEQTAIESLNKADIFIRQYRQILNTEE